VNHPNFGTGKVFSLTDTKYCTWFIWFSRVF